MFPPRSRNSGRMREEHDIGHHHHHHHHHHHKLPEPNDSSGDERDESGLQKLEDWWRHKRGHHDKRSHSDPTPKLKKHEKVRRDPAENRGGSSGDDEASDLSGPEDDQPSEPDSDLDQGQPRNNSGLSARLTSNADNATGRTSAPPPGSGWRTPSDEQTGVATDSGSDQSAPGPLPPSASAAPAIARMPAPPPPQQPVSFTQASPPPFPPPPVQPLYPPYTNQQYTPPAPRPAYPFKTAPPSTEDQERANALWIQAHSGPPQAANAAPVPGPPPLPDAAAFTPSMQQALPGRFVPTTSTSTSTSQQQARSLPGAFIPQPASAASPATTMYPGATYSPSQPASSAYPATPFVPQPASSAYAAATTYPPAPYATMSSPAMSYPPAQAAPPMPSYSAAAQALSPSPSPAAFVPTPRSPPLAAPFTNASAWQAPGSAFPNGADPTSSSIVGGSPNGADCQAGNFSDDSGALSSPQGDDARSSLSTIPGRFQQQRQDSQASGPFAPGPRPTSAPLDQSAAGDSAPASSDDDFSDAAANDSAAPGGVPQHRGGMSAAATPIDDGSADRNLPAGPASRYSDSDNDYSDDGPSNMDNSSRPFSSSQHGDDASAPLGRDQRFQQQQGSQGNGPFAPGPRSTSAPLDQPADHDSAPASSDDDLSNAADDSAAPIGSPRQQRAMSAPAAPTYDDSADRYPNAQPAPPDSDSDVNYPNAGSSNMGSSSTRPFSTARAGTAGAAGMGGPAATAPDNFDPPYSSDSDQAFNPRSASAAGSDSSDFDSAPRSAPRNGPSSQRAFSPNDDDSDVASNPAFNPRSASSAPMDSADSDDAEDPPSRSARNPRDVGGDRFSPGATGGLGGGADPNAGGDYAPDSDSDQQSDFGQAPVAYAAQRRNVGRPDSASGGGDSALPPDSGDGYDGDNFAGNLGSDGGADQTSRAQRAGSYAQDPDAHTDSSADETPAPALGRQDSGMAGRDGFGAPSSAPNDASPADDYQTSPDDGDRAQAPSSRDGQSASRADFPPSSSRNDSGRNDFGSDYDSDQALQGSDGGLSSSGPRRDSRDDVGVHTDSDGYDPDSASNAPPRTSGAADQDLQSPSAGTLGRGGLDPGDDANLSDNELDAQRKPAGATDDYADPPGGMSAVHGRPGDSNDMPNRAGDGDAFDDPSSQPGGAGNDGFRQDAQDPDAFSPGGRDGSAGQGDSYDSDGGRQALDSPNLDGGQQRSDASFGGQRGESGNDGYGDRGSPGLGVNGDGYGGQDDSGYGAANSQGFGQDPPSGGFGQDPSTNGFDQGWNGGGGSSPDNYGGQGYGQDASPGAYNQGGNYDDWGGGGQQGFGNDGYNNDWGGQGGGSNWNSNSGRGDGWNDGPDSRWSDPLNDPAGRNDNSWNDDYRNGDYGNGYANDDYRNDYADDDRDGRYNDDELPRHPSPVDDREVDYQRHRQNEAEHEINQARHQVRKALRHLLELEKHRHDDEQYSKAFRNALRCVYRLQHLQEEAEAWPVAPYPTAEQLGLRDEDYDKYLQQFHERQELELNSLDRHRRREISEARVLLNDIEEHQKERAQQKERLTSHTDDHKLAKNHLDAVTAEHKAHLQLRHAREHLRALEAQSPPDQEAVEAARLHVDAAEAHLRDCEDATHKAEQDAHPLGREHQARVAEHKVKLAERHLQHLLKTGAPEPDHEAAGKDLRDKQESHRRLLQEVDHDDEASPNSHNRVLEQSVLPLLARELALKSSTRKRSLPRIHMIMQLDSDCYTLNNVCRISLRSVNGFTSICCHGMKSSSKTHTQRNLTSNAPAMTFILPLSTTFTPRAIWSRRLVPVYELPNMRFLATRKPFEPVSDSNISAEARRRRKNCTKPNPIILALHSQPTRLAKTVCVLEKSM
ncbi:hypothetical protein C6P46_000213 [Rhodotorula mucilaginosa]|uniref:Uncharacterized protein n=1 Tax=Rhodotorula mucilaginosa TaxID=5537 RepID=A0A9P6W976_RHOMI|nr:hypothetical protein C6P46_000213 [Rhodotorula mucilaginosa]